MNEPSDFKRLDVDPATLPGLVAELLEGRELLARLDPIDLREMAKLEEMPNVAGLAAHPIRRPIPGGFGVANAAAGSGPLAISPKPILPKGVMGPLAKAMRIWPTVVIEGLIGGATQTPVAVRFLVPRPYAHLAAALQAMLWPLAEGATEKTNWAYQLLAWPEPVKGTDEHRSIASFVGHWPAEATGLAVGFDDPGLMAELLLDAARRRWMEIAPGLRILEAGQWALRNETGSPFARVTTPQGPEEACWEPLVLEADLGVSPAWRNPLLPAAAVASCRVWRDAALTVGSLPFGARVDADGRFLLESAAADDRPEGWFVIPRQAIAPPWLRMARRFPLAKE